MKSDGIAGDPNRSGCSAADRQHQAGKSAYGLA